MLLHSEMIVFDYLGAGYIESEVFDKETATRSCFQFNRRGGAILLAKARCSVPFVRT